VGKLSVSHRYNLRTLAAVKPWGIPRELVVRDFPVFCAAKVSIIFEKTKYILKSAKKYLIY
jgi:hypothetical protein